MSNISSVWARFLSFCCRAHRALTTPVWIGGEGGPIPAFTRWGWQCIDCATVAAVDAGLPSPIVGEDRTDLRYSRWSSDRCGGSGRCQARFDVPNTVDEGGFHASRETPWNGSEEIRVRAPNGALIDLLTLPTEAWASPASLRAHCIASAKRWRAAQRLVWAGHVVTGDFPPATWRRVAAVFATLEGLTPSAAVWVRIGPKREYGHDSVKVAASDLPAYALAVATAMEEAARVAAQAEEDRLLARGLRALRGRSARVAEVSAWI